jgi:hypothetical protein
MFGGQRCGTTHIYRSLGAKELTQKRAKIFVWGGEEGTVVLHIKRVFCSLQMLSETFLILRRIKRNIIINVHRSSCNVPVTLVTVYEP